MTWVRDSDTPSAEHAAPCYPLALFDPDRVT